jgi:hypothetical protein
VPSVQEPEALAVNSDAHSFRRLSVAASVAVIAMPLTWVYGTTSYSGGTAVLADGLRVLLALVVFVAGGTAIWRWLASARDGFDSLTRDTEAHANHQAACRAYERQLDQYHHLTGQYNQAETKRLAALTVAEESRVREHRVADTLDALARRSRITIADLTDVAMMSRLRAIASQVENSPAP